MGRVGRTQGWGGVGRSLAGLSHCTFGTRPSGLSHRLVLALL